MNETAVQTLEGLNGEETREFRAECQRLARLCEQATEAFVVDSDPWVWLKRSANQLRQVGELLGSIEHLPLEIRRRARG